MIYSRFIAALVIVASTAATAQQVPTVQRPPAPVAKPDKRLQVSCRVNRSGNMLKRVCMTNEQWEQAESGVSDAMDAMRLHDRLRCSSSAC